MKMSDYEGKVLDISVNADHLSALISLFEDAYFSGPKLSESAALCLAASYSEMAQIVSLTWRLASEISTELDALVMERIEEDG